MTTVEGEHRSDRSKLDADEPTVTNGRCLVLLPDGRSKTDAEMHDRTTVCRRAVAEHLPRDTELPEDLAGSPQRQAMTSV